MEKVKTRILAALCQTPPPTGKEESLGYAVGYITKAAEQGAELVILPEMFCCPYNTAAFPENAEPVQGRIWQALSDAARTNQVILVGGSFPEMDESGRIYNSCFVFDKNGGQLARHRKVHLFDIEIPGGQCFKESHTLTGGNELTLFDTPAGRVGAMICFDVRFPEFARLTALEGAGAIVIPAAFNMTTGPAHWELLMKARAVDNFTYILACAPARGSGEGYVSYANSLVVSPWGETVARLDDKPDILYCELDFARVAELRLQVPVLTARRTDLYTLDWKGTSS